MPVISILTPVYNGMPYIKECVNSVLSQNFQDWELIISDNGSNDGTREYLRTLADPRIRVVEQPVDLNCFGNCNFILKEASAPLFQILCADDYFMSQDSLSQILRFWEKQPAGLGFARTNWGHDCGKIRFFSKKKYDNPYHHFAVRTMPAVVKPEQSDFYFFLFGCIPGNLSNVSGRTQVVRDCGFFNSKFFYAADYEYWSRVGRRTGFAVSQEHPIYLRVHPGAGSVSGNQKGEAFSQMYTIIQDLFNRLKPQYPAFYLRLHVTAHVGARLRYSALSIWRRSGSNVCLKELNRVESGSDAVLPAPARWLVFILTAGGRFGLATCARRLLHSSPKIS